MNVEELEERVQSLSDYSFINDSERENPEFFFLCLKHGKMCVALKCDSFITRDFLFNNSEQIIEAASINFPDNLRSNRDFRDLLVEKKKYDLLVEFEYALLKELQDETLFVELNKVADKLIESGNIFASYAKYRAMELKKYELFKDNTFPNEKEFYDLYYEDAVKIMNNVRYHNHFFLLKALEIGDFETADKLGMLISLDDEEIDKVVEKHWDKALNYTNDSISRLFSESRLLFNHYLNNNRFDLVSQFSHKLLTSEIIDKHEKEIIDNIGLFIGPGAKWNSSLYYLCLKYKRYDLCVQFYVDISFEEIKPYANEFFENVVELPYAFREDPEALKFVLKIGRYDLVKDFDDSVFDSDIISEYGDNIVDALSAIPYGLSANSELLLIVLKRKKYELVNDFYGDAFTPSVLASQEFIDYIKTVDNLHYTYYDKPLTLVAIIKAERWDLFESNIIGSSAYNDEIIRDYGSVIIQHVKKLPYKLSENPLILKVIVETGRYDLVNELLSFVFDSELFDEYVDDFARNISRIPYSLAGNSKMLKAVLQAKRPELLSGFNTDAFTEELIYDYIDSLPLGADDFLHAFNKPDRIRKVLERNRLDLINKNNVSSKSLDDELLREFAEVLIPISEDVPVLNKSSVLLTYAIEHKMADEIKKFSIRAFSEEIIAKYGEILYPLIETKLIELDDSNLIVWGGLIHNEDAGPLKNASLLRLVLKHGKHELLRKFSSSLFTSEIIDEYYPLLLKSFLEHGIMVLGNNAIFLRKFLMIGDLTYLWRFNERAFNSEIIAEFGELLIDYYDGKDSMDYSVITNSLLLKKAIQMDAKHVISLFYPGAFNKEIVDEFYDYLLEIIEANKGVPTYMQSDILFYKLLEEKKYDLAKDMKIRDLDSDYIRNNYEELLKLLEYDYNSSFASYILGEIVFVNEYIKTCPVEKYTYLDKSLFIDNYMDYYHLLVEWIAKYNRNMIPEELFNCRRLKEYCKEHGLNDLYIKFSFSTITGVYTFKEKVDFDSLVVEYAPLLQLTEKELRERLSFLLSKNDEILDTIVPKILDKRFDVLALKHKLTICLYPDLQEEIIGLNDKQLLLIDRILDCTDIVMYDTTYILYNVLRNMRYYEFLIDNELTEEQLNNLIYVLQRKENIYNIEKLNDLTNLGLLTKMLFKFKQFENNLVDEKDINKVREMILLKKYGLDIKEASFINERYCMDSKVVMESELSENLKALLIDINKIVKCTNIEELKFMYSASDMVFADFKSTLYLEAYIRSEYARLYDKSLYKTKDEDLVEHHEDLVTNPEALDKIKNMSYDGKKPKVYILTDDFNLDIHALGAYSGYKRPDNFLADWNQPKMASHGLCTSYIGNNQIANARAYHPILGFDTIDGDGLLLAANYDIGSSMANVKYATSREMAVNFLPPKEMINYTRHTHNEVVLERMKYVGMVACKRMPSYIVYLLDDINNKYNFMTKLELVEELKNEGVSEEITDKISTEKDLYFIDRLLKDEKIDSDLAHKISCVFYYEEVVQSSIDFGVPIVIVDRLYFAKREKRKCDVIFEKLIQTQDANYISLLLLTYFNNMIGCIDYTGRNLEYCQLFNDDGLDELIDKIIDSIDQISDNNIKMHQLEVLLKELNFENYKRETFKGGAPRQIKPLQGHVDKINKRIEDLKNVMTEGYNGKNI